MAQPPSDADLLAVADRQSAAFFLATRDRPWSTIHEDADVVHGSTGLPLAIFNGATNARFSAETADARIEAVLRPFRELRQDMSWLVGATSAPPDLVDRLVEHGLTIEEVAPVMARSLADGPPSPAPAPGITTELVADHAGFHVATEIMFGGFEMPTDVMPMFEERYLEFAIGPDAIQRVFLARLDGRPVATSLAFILDGIVGIYNVATLLDARGRGAGSAVTAAAVADAAERGAVAAVLESSESGHGVYARLGFRDIGSITVLFGAFGSAR